MNELITSRELQDLFGLGRTAALNLTRQPDFPAPYRINGRTFRWDRKEVLAWLEARKGQGSRPASKRPQPNGRRFTVDGVTFRTVA